MSQKEPEDLEMTIADIDEAIEQATQTHMQMTQNVGMLISQLSDISHTIGRYHELKRLKLDMEEAKDAVKH